MLSYIYPVVPSDGYENSASKFKHAFLIFAQHPMRFKLPRRFLQFMMSATSAFGEDPSVSETFCRRRGPYICQNNDLSTHTQCQCFAGSQHASEETGRGYGCRNDCRTQLLIRSYFHFCHRWDSIRHRRHQGIFEQQTD